MTAQRIRIEAGDLKLTIRPAEPGEAAWLKASFSAYMGWSKPERLFHDYLERQAKGELALLVARAGAGYSGHCAVIWRSPYPGFRERNIPEIQDLNVRPEYRRRGIGSSLLAEAERRIAQRSEYAGIGFGLYAEYGAAQRLYIKRGYVPDGRGVYYNGEPVSPGARYPVDDGLVLYLLKRL